MARLIISDEWWHMYYKVMNDDDEIDYDGEGWMVKDDVGDGIWWIVMVVVMMMMISYDRWTIKDDERCFRGCWMVINGKWWLRVMMNDDWWWWMMNGEWW